MARDGWFDGEGFDLNAGLVRDLAGRLAGYGSDCAFRREEWEEQRARVMDALQALEGTLDDATHAALTRVLYDYEVLLFMTQHVQGALRWDDETGQISLF